MYELRDKLVIAVLVVVVFVVGIIFGNVVPLNPPPKEQPIIIHKADNAGAEMHGRITDKEIIEGRYTVTAGAYGKFLVTKEQYDSLSVGDEIPDYLRGGGN